jgi:hypothetical protein
MVMEELRVDLKKLKFQLNQNKGKERREDVWCTFCKIKGHHKKECLNLAHYLEIGILNPLPLGEPWCEICRTHGHDPSHFPVMKNYQIVPKTIFCNFCKSVGHEDKDCRTLEMMKERKSYEYMVQAKLMTTKPM